MPAIAAAILETKEIALKQEKPPHHIFGVDTIGMMNGLIDFNIQLPQLVKYPNNNSYGIELYNASMVNKLNADSEICGAQSKECERVLEEMNYDPLGDEPMPNICFAGAICWIGIADVFDTVARVRTATFLTFIRLCAYHELTIAISATHSTSGTSCPTAFRLRYT